MAKHKVKIIRGNADRPRLAVYRSLSQIYAQVINDTDGKTLVSASSLNIQAPKGTKGKFALAEVVGKEIATRAKAAGIEKVVFDRRSYHYHGRVKALAEAARQGGLQF